MCIGAGLSPMLRLDIAMLILAGYLCLSIYTYIGAILKGEFRLTYSSFGPTEFRLIVILINTFYMYMPWSSANYYFYGIKLGIIDIVGFIIAVLLFVAYSIQFIKDKEILSKQDPLKKNNNTDN